LATVRLCEPLTAYTGDKRSVSVGGCANVGELLAALGGMFPGIDRRILDDQDRIREYVNVFLNGEAVEGPPEKTVLTDGDEVFIVQSVAGG
jgi:sulfur-carrier protein